MRRTVIAFVCTVLAAVGVATTADASPLRSGASTAAKSTARTVMYVGNNWDGTATVVDAASMQKLGTLNVVPDYDERMAEIQSNPDKLAYFLAIRQQIGEGHDQLVDDMFSTPDGRLVAVSRPSFADVVGINTRTRKIVWRFPMHGYRADHMAENPAGTRILVSDSTANHVDELDIRTGRLLRQFPSGDTPHESNYSKDGSLIYHASIGRIYTPTDPSQFCPLTDPTKGDQRFEIVSNDTFQIMKQWDIGQKLKDAGFDCMSSAVRPMAISPDETRAYLQVSFFHGYVVFDLVNGKVLDVVDLPNRVPDMPKSQYVLNSAHHGIALDSTGSIAGTMDDYVALVDVADPQHRTILDLRHQGDRPYWATNGPDATRCWVSIAGDDRVNVYGYADDAQVGSVGVGDHPQRNRVGHLTTDALAAWGPGAPPAAR